MASSCAEGDVLLASYCLFVTAIAVSFCKLHLHMLHMLLSHSEFLMLVSCLEPEQGKVLS